MINEIDLLNDICKTAEMGRDNLSHVVEQALDDELRGVLRNQMEKYQDSYEKACNLLREHGETPEHASNMAKAMAHVSTDMKTMWNDSSSKLAEMVIQGNTMGITKITQRLHEYGGKNQKVIDLAKQEITKQQANIEELKKYL